MHMIKLVEEGPVLLSQPQLIEHFGRAGAQFINQIHYWLTKSQGFLDENGRKWIYNTEETWSQQLCLSARQVRRYISKFMEQGVLYVQKLSSHKSNRTNYFSLNYEALEAVLTSNIGSKSTESGTFVHPDIVSLPSGQKGPMVIQKIPNKDFKNKSEEKERGTSCYQVEQVPILENSNEKEDGQGGGKANTTVQDMIVVWNNCFETSQAKLSKDLAKNLMGAFKHKFDQNLEKWQHYCQLIASSSYLMDEKFTLTLPWALKFGTIDRILKGDLGVQNVVFTPSEETLVQKAQEHIETVQEEAICQKARQLILKAIGAPSYLSWFTRVDFVMMDGKTCLKPHDVFVEDAIQRKFGYLLEKYVLGL